MNNNNKVNDIKDKDKYKRVIVRQNYHKNNNKNKRFSDNSNNISTGFTLKLRD